MKKILMNTNRILIILPLILAAVTVAQAEVQMQAIEYKDGEVELTGHIAWDDAIQGKRPGVIVVHEWWGLNDYARKRAEMLAKLGYVAFAIDMYGKDKVTEHPKEAGEWSKQITANVEQWQKRALLGLDILRGHELTDPERTAAIGYCFGGATVMQMAYSGTDLAGVVSFHGSLPPPQEGQAVDIKSKIFVAHGKADPFIPAERIAAFQEAMETAGADWQMTYYAGAKHSFTNPGADTRGINGLGYDEKADRRSWQQMQHFFAEIFAQ